jgi:hypothetical protein
MHIQDLDINTGFVNFKFAGDFEEAVARGATCIRVGSTIFGERDYSAAREK